MKKYIIFTIKKMKNSVLIVLFFCLTSADCDFDGHFTIYVKNKSSSTVIAAELYKFVRDNGAVCYLLGGPIKKDEIWEYRPFNNSIEKDLGWDTLKFYIVDPSKYSFLKYSCDSIKQKNKVLKIYDVTLAYLQKHDFTVTYP